MRISASLVLLATACTPQAPSVVASAPSSTAAPAPPPEPTPPPRTPIADASAAPAPPVAPRAQKSACRADLSEFCRREPCRSFDATRAGAQSKATPQSDAGLSDLDLKAQIGTCGATRFVSLGDSYSGWTQYFDASGKLMGASRWSDTNSFCSGHSFSIEYGVVPDACP